MVKRLWYWLQYHPEADYIMVGVAIHGLLHAAYNGEIQGVLINAIVIGILRYSGHQRLRYIIAVSVEDALEKRGEKV